MRVVAVAAAIALSTATLLAAAPSKRQELSNQSRKRLTRVAGTMTIFTWTEHVDDFLGRAPNGKALGAKWNSKEPHWDKAHDQIILKIMSAYDDLSAAPEAHRRMDMPFQSPLTEEEAAEVLALSPEDRQRVDNWNDAIGLGVFMATQHPDLKIGSPAWKSALKNLGNIAGVPTDLQAPPDVKLSKAAMDHYKQARNFGAEFLRIAVDGQLQLFFFDRREAFLKIANDAAAAAYK
ncbi:MAG TPA: hypothetical protein VGJ82_10995 [Thermoanaerobaculia bacterium]|jgi:hypothetical protein